MIFKKSIRKRLVILCITLSILPLLLLGGVMAWQSFVVHQEQAQKFQREVSKRSEQQIVLTMHDLEDDMRVMTKTTSLITTDLDTKYKILSKLRMYKGLYHQDIINEIALLGSTGEELVRISNKAVYAPDDLKTRSGSDEFAFPVAERETYYSPVYFEEESGNPLMKVSIPLIHAVTGKVEAVLSSEINIKFIWEVIASMRIGESGFAFIIDRSNRVIAHKDPSVVLRGTYWKPPLQPGFGEGLHGSRSFIASEEMFLGDQVYHIVTELPASEALRQTRRSITTIAAFLLLTLSGALALALIIMRWIVKPVESLSKTALAIGNGDMTQKAIVSESDEIGVLADTFNKMTSRLIETIASLQKEKSTLQKYLDTAAVLVAIVDADQNVNLVNKKGCELLGYTEDEIIGKNWFDNFLPESNKKEMKEFHSRAVAGKVDPVEYNENVIVTKNGDERLIAWYNTVFRNSNGIITATLSSGTDITERRQAETALKDSQERLVTVLDSLDAIVYVADMDTHEILFINKYTRDVFGDVEGGICWQVLQSEKTGPCEFCTNDKLVVSNGKSSEVYNWEFQNTLNDKWYYIQDRAIRWVDGRTVRLEIATDITDRKTSEEKIRASLKEKEVLLREVHHRVKNNMQVITSLLNFQTSYCTDKESVEMLKESQNRIRSMALIHEKLYRSKEMSNINFNEYIHSLGDSLFRFYGINTNNVSLDIQVEGIELKIDTAIPCGLIINELLSNSFKYAFPEGRSGEIKVTLEKFEVDGESEMEMIISDNGIGIQESIDMDNIKSLGLKLVYMLVENQLQGHLKLKRTGGTEFSIRFKEPFYKKRI